MQHLRHKAEYCPYQACQKAAFIAVTTILRINRVKEKGWKEHFFDPLLFLVDICLGVLNTT